MRVAIAVFLSLFIFASNVNACTCELIWFCDFINYSNTNHIFYGKVIEKKVYSESNHAVYLEVIEKIRGAQTTDTVKLYGVEYNTWCEESIGVYELDERYIFAFNDSLVNGFYPIHNPDSLTENFTEYHPITCSRKRLYVTETDTVRGLIQEGLVRYPLNQFLEDISDCSFTLSQNDQINTQSQPFVFYPNPVQSEMNISGGNCGDSISSIKFFNVNGKIMQHLKNYVPNTEPIDLNFLPNGIYLVELICNGVLSYQKIIKNSL